MIPIKELKDKIKTVRNELREMRLYGVTEIKYQKTDDKLFDVELALAKIIGEANAQANVGGSLPIEFLEWTEKGMWTKWESRNDGYHEMNGWYNTHNFATMKQPLSSQELFDLFMLERSGQ